jgi:hypothetical protein
MLYKAFSLTTPGSHSVMAATIPTMSARSVSGSAPSASADNAEDAAGRLISTADQSGYYPNGLKGSPYKSHSQELFCAPPAIAQDCGLLSGADLVNLFKHRNPKCATTFSSPAALAAWAAA